MKTLKLSVVALLLLLPLASRAQQYFEMTTNSCPNPSLTFSGISGDILVCFSAANGTSGSSGQTYSTCTNFTTGNATLLQPGQSKSVSLAPNLTYGIWVGCLGACADDLEATTTTNSPLAINPWTTVETQKGQPVAGSVTITFMNGICMKAKTPVNPALQSIKQLNKTNFTNKYKTAFPKGIK